MTGAMYAAIAGLRTHMQNLNVIGNNVANVNTYGYKSARSVFETAIYTSLNGGSDGTATLGGANPSQIGYGANMGSVGIDMSTGNYAITGRNCDLMLDGDGFFIMGKKDVAEQFNGTGEDQSVLDGMNLSRVGNFDFGADGYLARDASDGLCVYGFNCVGTDPNTGEPIFSDQLAPIRIPGIGKNATTGELEIKYPIPGEVGTDGQVQYKEGGVLMDQTQVVAGTTNQYETCPRTRLEAITFDSVTGVITAKSKDTGALITIGAIAVGNVQNPNGVTNLGSNYYMAGKGSGGLSVSLLGGLSKTANWGTPDGNGGFTMSSTSGYMNQSRVTNGNAGGGNNNQGQGNNITDVCRLGDGGETRLLSNGLEMSKTDLAQEISQMILTQRGYQANTRIVTVTDSMLEELVNMKR